MEVQEEFGDQVRFVGVPGLSSLGNYEEFIEDTSTTGFEHLNDADGAIWDRFGVTEQRTYVYLNDDGTWRTSGYGSLEADVQELINT